MSEIEVYLKKDGLNYQEKRLIKNLRTAISQKGLTEKDFKVARTFSELKDLNNKTRRT